MLSIAGGIIVAVLIIKAWPPLVLIPFLAVLVWFTVSNPLMAALVAVGFVGAVIFSRLPAETRDRWTKHRGILKDVRQ